MTNLPAVITGEQFDTMQRMAKAMVASGYFKDAADVAKAIVKIQAGSELGLAPFASMTGIHIISGKPTLSANLIATLVKNDPRYDYKVKKADDDSCLLMWLENGEGVGFSSFNIDEAKIANLTGKAVWKQYPSDMLFARAITRGARRFAPGIFGGAPVYTPEELGADTDQDGNVVEGELVNAKPANPDKFPSHKTISESPKSPQNSNGPDWTESEPAPVDSRGESSPQAQAARAAIKVPMPTKAMTKKFHATGKDKYGDAWDDRRPLLVKAITAKREDGPAVTSSNDLNRAEMKFLIDGMVA